MAKIEGPLLSIDAHGTIAGALTFQRRSYNNSACAVVYAPKTQTLSATAAQLARRALLAGAITTWQSMSPAERAEYQAAATASDLSPYHAFLKAQLLAPPPPSGSIWDGGTSTWDGGASAWPE